MMDAEFVDKLNGGATLVGHPDTLNADATISMLVESGVTMATLKIAPNLHCKAGMLYAVNLQGDFPVGDLPFDGGRGV